MTRLTLYTSIIMLIASMIAADRMGVVLGMWLMIAAALLQLLAVVKGIEEVEDG